jgi:predicted ATPase
MITYIKINGFKSFHNFEMEFTPFTVIAGANASGKSNLFDALMLLSYFTDMGVDVAFDRQRGLPSELFTQYDDGSSATEMEFIVRFIVNDKVKVRNVEDTVISTTEISLEDREFQYEIKIKYLPNEPDNNIFIVRELFKTAQSDYVHFSTNDILASYQITAINIYGNTSDKIYFIAAKEEMRSWRMLKLSAEEMEKPQSAKFYGNRMLAYNGINLGAVLYRMKQEDDYNLVEVARRVQRFLPNFTAVDVEYRKENNDYLIRLTDRNKREYTSRVLSEGTLYVLAYSALLYNDLQNGVLCIEEPENGIHPACIEEMMDLFKEFSEQVEGFPLRQVIMNTHSPVVVSHIHRWEEDKNASLWYAQLKHKVATIEDKKIGLTVTSILPVVKNNEVDLSEFPNYSEAEKKYTLYHVKQYLETVK